MKRKGECDISINSLTDMMRESNMFDEYDEYKLLLEGYQCKKRDLSFATLTVLLEKAVSRYNRYIKNVNFGDYSYIEELIITFIQKYESKKKDTPWTLEAMEEMGVIDGEILQIIQMETDNSKKVKMK